MNLLYDEFFGTKERLVVLMSSLYVKNDPIATRDKWMSFTNMGYVITSRYNVVLVHLPRVQSWNFFLLRSQPSSIAQQ